MNDPCVEQMAPNRYFDRYFQQDAVKILPGEFYATQSKRMIVTVLGSCVAVCLRDRRTGFGGMNHFLLPGDITDSGNFLAESARYGNYAMELLINQLIKLGANRNQLEAKVFGGANLMQRITVNNVGQRNAEFTLDYLRMENIPLLAQDLLDVYPRKIYFFPETGKVLVKKLRVLHNTTILDRESEYRMRMRHAPTSGEVDFF